MNIINKLTLRQLKMNKKRTLITIIGTIISVAMITAVATLSISFLDLMQRQSIADDGLWHVLYQNVNLEQLKAIQDDEKTDTLIISKDLGYALLENSQNENRPYLFIKQYNAEGFENFPITLKDGRFPQSETEIIISEEIASNAGVTFELADQLTLDVGQRILNEENRLLNQHEGLMDESFEYELTKTYTIVGIMDRPRWEPTWAPGYTVISYLDETLIGNDLVHASVIISKPDLSIYTHAETLVAELGIDSYRFNHNLLRYQGVTSNDGLRSTLYSMATIITFIIVTGSVALIYNAFAISVSERARHLGMLSSVGATKSQKRNSVFFEGAIIGTISIPIGILMGLGGMTATFYFINHIIEEALGISEKLKVVVTPSSILVACTVSMLTIFISTYLPARKASKITAIEAIRQTTDVKLTRKKVKTTKLVRKLFGIEAEIGLKNLKRNKRKYQVTVFSLVISIVLYLTVVFFTATIEKAVDLSMDTYDHDIVVYNPTDDAQIKAIIEQEDVTSYSIVTSVQLGAWVEESQVSLDIPKEWLEDGMYRYNVIISGVDDLTLQAFAKELNISIDQLYDSEKFSAIVIDQVTFHDWETNKYVDTKAIYTKVGDKLALHETDWETYEHTLLNEIEVFALLDRVPMGVWSPRNLGEITVIVPKVLVTEFVGDTNKVYTELFLQTNDPMKTQYYIDELNKELSYHNHYHYHHQDKQFLLFISIFVYGFITLITSISVANILNTISTSISLRKREFAMLKSVGMTPKSFMRMIHFESIFYGLKAVLYGLPVSIAIMYWIHHAMMHSFSYDFTLPLNHMIYVVIAVFIIVGLTMMYSTSKVRKENIIDVLKQENI